MGRWVGVGSLRLAPVLVVIVCALVLAASYAFILLRPQPIQAVPSLTEKGTSVFAVPLSGETPHLAARLHGQYGFPVSSGDGRSLLVEKPTVLGPTALWSVPLRGGHSRWVGALPIFEQAVWSPDRTQYATTTMNGSVTIDSLDGRVLRTITAHKGLGGISVSSWRGNFLAVERDGPALGWRSDVEVWRATGGRVWTVPNVGSPMAAVAPGGNRVALVSVHDLVLVTRHTRRVLATDASQVTPLWTPDGSQVLYFTNGGRLMLEDVTTHSRRTVASGRIGEASLSPDGRTVYVVGLGAKPAVNIPK